MVYESYLIYQYYFSITAVTLSKPSEAIYEWKKSHQYRFSHEIRNNSGVHTIFSVHFYSFAWPSPLLKAPTSF